MIGDGFIIHCPESVELLSQIFLGMKKIGILWRLPVGSITSIFFHWFMIFRALLDMHFLHFFFALFALNAMRLFLDNFSTCLFWFGSNLFPISLGCVFESHFNHQWKQSDWTRLFTMFIRLIWDSVLVNVHYAHNQLVRYFRTLVYASLFLFSVFFHYRLWIIFCIFNVCYFIALILILFIFLRIIFIVFHIFSTFFISNIFFDFIDIFQSNPKSS